MTAEIRSGRFRLATSAVAMAALALATLFFIDRAHAGTNTWTSIGPEGASVVSLAMDPGDAQTIYAGTSDSGIFKTTDGGASWQAVLMTYGPIDSLVVASSGHVYFSSGQEVRRSTDGGTSWTGGYVPEQVRDIAIDPAETTIYAGTFRGVYASTDGGANWTVTGLSAGYVDAIGVVPGTPQAILAAIPNEPIRRSTDGGATWTVATLTGGDFANLQIRGFWLDPSTPGTVWAVAYELLKSTDGGATWSVIGGYPSLVTLAIQPTSPPTLWGSTGQAILMSVNGGVDWATVRTGLQYAAALVVDPTAAGTLYVGDMELGVEKTTDGGTTWAPSQHGLVGYSIRAFAIDPANSAVLYAGGGYARLIRSLDRGTTWSVTTASPWAGIIAIGVAATSPTSAYASFSGSTERLVKSTDNGATWSPATAAPNLGGLPYGWVRAIVADPGDPNTVYVGLSNAQPEGVFKTTDGGDTWTAPAASLSNLTALAIDPSNPSVFYAGTRSSGVFKSIDGGSTWSATGLTSGNVSSVVVDPVTPTTVYASTVYGSGVQRSTDGGATWSVANTGMSHFFVNALALDPSDSAVLYAATYMGGVYKTTDGAANWSQMNAGLTNLDALAVTVDVTTQGRVYVGTHRSVFVIDQQAPPVDKADLVVTSVSDPPASIAPGGVLLVSDTVANQGTLAAGASITRYYLSTDALKSAGDVALIGGRLIQELGSGQSAGGPATATVPASTALGTYYLIACADGDSEIAESNETNNCRASASMVSVGGIDLLVTEVRASSASVGPGARFTVTDTVLNQGTKSAPASRTRYYLSADGVKDAGDVRFATSRAVPILAPGASHAGSVSVVVPSGTPPGDYRLLACADDYAAVAETNETNNCTASVGWVTVLGADLVLTDLGQPPASIARGARFTITDTVENRGTFASRASRNRYYFSADGFKSADDVRLTGVRSVAALAPGAVSAGSVLLTVPTTAMPGTYRLIACADDLLAVAELDEVNNCRASATTVYVPGGDLVVTAVDASPATVPRGGRLTASDIVQNVGTASATASRVRYYLSRDTVRDDSDVRLTGVRNVVALAPGATSSGTALLTVPLGTVPGSYSLLACADDYAVVRELDETNNCLASVSTVTIVP